LGGGTAQREADLLQYDPPVAQRGYNGIYYDPKVV
jgi:hypothetical protein